MSMLVRPDTDRSRLTLRPYQEQCVESAAAGDARRAQTAGALRSHGIGQNRNGRASHP